MSQRETIARLEQDLQQASNMVLLAMSTSSDLGQVVEFLKTLYFAADIEQLASDLLNHLQLCGLDVMSHELRTPLNPIIGFSKILQRKLAGQISEKDLSKIEVIRDNGEQLHHLISNILDLSDIEHGELDIHKKKVCIRQLVEKTLNKLQPKAAKNKTSLSMIADGDFNAFLDPVRIEQLVAALVTNAIAHTPSGEVLVSLEIQELDDRGNFLILTVQDSGEGIAREDQQRIFDPFTQVDSSMTRKTGGVGLSLYIVKCLVERHGGFIDLHSEPGRGSTFTVSLPMKQS